MTHRTARFGTLACRSLAVGAALIALALAGPTLPAQTDPSCQGCRILDSEHILDDWRFDVVAKVFTHDDTNADKNFYAATITFIQNADGYFQDFNWNIMWAQKGAEVGLLDRSPGRAHHEPDSQITLGVNMQGPFVSWTFNSGDTWDWELWFKETAWDGDWHHRWEAEYADHSQGKAVWTRNTDALSVEVQSGREAGVWVYAGVDVGKRASSAGWHESDFVWIPVQSASTAVRVSCPVQVETVGAPTSPTLVGASREVSTHVPMMSGIPASCDSLGSTVAPLLILPPQLDAQRKAQEILAESGTTLM